MNLKRKFLLFKFSLESLPSILFLFFFYAGIHEASIQSCLSFGHDSHGCGPPRSNPARRLHFSVNPFTPCTACTIHRRTPPPASNGCTNSHRSIHRVHAPSRAGGVRRGARPSRPIPPVTLLPFRKLPLLLHAAAAAVAWLQSATTPASTVLLLLS